METSRIEQRCEIEQVNNGFILTYNRIYNDDSSEIQKELYANITADNTNSFANMVFDLMDIFCVYNCSVKFFDKDENEIKIE